MRNKHQHSRTWRLMKKLAVGDHKFLVYYFHFC